LTLELEAWECKREELTPEQAVAINASPLASVRTGADPDHWYVETESRIGVLRLSDGLELRVAPKIPIPQLMFLLGYAADPKGWRDVGPSFGSEPDLFGAVSAAFAAHAERAIVPVPLQGYVTVEDRATTLRGTLRVGDQLARWPGLPLPLEIAYDDYTADVAENRLVLGAAELLLRLPLVPLLVRQRLLRLRVALDGVTPAAPGPAVEAPPTTRLNGRYRSVLALAALVLRSTSISTDAGKTAGVEFVFDMNKVFEDFVAAAFREALAPYGGTVQEQNGNHYLDEERTLRLKPDLTWWRAGRCRAVIDAKYKAIQDKRFPNADAYQMLAYCTGLLLPEAHLIYAKGEGPGSRVHSIDNAAVAIHVHALDLEAAPSGVLAQVAALATRIHDTAARRPLAA
jgi:5-methylcytosine-specific restriction enzyme subunit McrC